MINEVPYVHCLFVEELLLHVHNHVVFFKDNQSLIILVLVVLD